MRPPHGKHEQAVLFGVEGADDDIGVGMGVGASHWEPA